MYRILLADDDPLMLSGVKQLIDWKKNDCVIAGTAFNGTDALKKIEKLRPDVVICDIAMPGLSGLDVLKKAAAEFPGVVFIMLTNHEDFELAREAMHNRAVEYLVKNNLESEALESALERAIAERKNRNKLYQVEEAEEHLQTRQRQNQIREAVSRILYGTGGVGTSGTFSTTRAATLLEEEGMLSRFAFALIPLNFAVLPGYPEIPAAERRKILEWEIEIAERLASSFFPHILLLPGSAAGDPQNDRTDESSDFHSSESSDFHSSESSDFHSSESSDFHSSESSDFHSSESLGLFAWALTQDRWSAEDWEAGVDQFQERLIKTSLKLTRLRVEVLASSFYESGGTGKKRKTGIWKSLPDELARLEQQHYGIRRGKHTEVLEKARRYILNNVEKEIMLADVADYAAISPGYLSTLFKREYNLSLIEFANQLKIERACELLWQNKYRVNEISNMLGFENPVYFARIFRRHVGINPSEYLARVCGGGGGVEPPLPSDREYG